jgi:TorA maturation chaperone TorD
MRWRAGSLLDRDAERTGIDAKANRRAGRRAGARDSRLPEEVGGSVAWDGSAPLTMPAELAPIRVVHRLEPEDQARANFYAVLTALFADAPDASLLRVIGAADALPDAESGTLPHAWNTLVEACRAMDAEAARQEYVDLFVGTGKSEVNLHASHWATGFMMEKPLVALRDELAGLGLGRLPRSNLLEDHAAALFETMRLLIEGGEHGPPASLAVQRGFFERNLAFWIDDCCNAISECSLANFYLRVAQFAHSFMAVERDSLAM